MSDKYFIDTNVFVYTFDPRAKKKQQTARALVREALGSGSGVVSYQVVQEFLNVSGKKFSKPMSAADQEEYLEIVLEPLCAVYPSPSFYRTGLRLANRYGFSFYDALIVAAGLEAGCATLYSEDLQDGQLVEKMTIRNPFA